MAILIFPRAAKIMSIRYRKKSFSGSTKLYFCKVSTLNWLAPGYGLPETLLQYGRPLKRKALNSLTPKLSGIGIKEIISKNQVRSCQWIKCATPGDQNPLNPKIRSSIILFSNKKRDHSFFCSWPEVNQLHSQFSQAREKLFLKWQRYPAPTMKGGKAFTPFSPCLAAPAVLKLALKIGFSVLFLRMFSRVHDKFS